MQPRLELQQRGDQHQELGRGLEIELAARLEVVEVGEDDVGELDLEQVDLLAQDQRQQQVERAREDLEVELELGRRSSVTAARLPGGADGPAQATSDFARVCTSFRWTAPHPG